MLQHRVRFMHANVSVGDTVSHAYAHMNMNSKQYTLPVSRHMRAGGGHGTRRMPGRLAVVSPTGLGTYLIVLLSYYWRTIEHMHRCTRVVDWSGPRLIKSDMRAWRTGAWRFWTLIEQRGPRPGCRSR
jgi:hypothetical protein